TDPAFIRQLHERAIDAADLIFYSSRKLFAEADRGREKSHLLEQAVDFDHCVLPWNTEVPFTSYGSAIKVREYLASGKPVVISPLPEYESMSDVLRIGRSREQFLSLVDEALQENDAAQVKARQNAVR